MECDSITGAEGGCPDVLRLICVECCGFRLFAKQGVPYKDGDRLWQTYRCSECDMSVYLESSVGVERDDAAATERSVGMTGEEVALSDRLREGGTPMFITDQLAQAASEFERRTLAAADQVTSG